MKAETMFKRLGYEMTHKYSTIEYTKNEIRDYAEYKTKVLFYDKRIFVNVESIDTTCKKAITLKELKAINKQCQELGWLDEN